MCVIYLCRPPAKSIGMSLNFHVHTAVLLDTSAKSKPQHSRYESIAIYFPLLVIPNLFPSQHNLHNI